MKDRPDLLLQVGTSDIVTIKRLEHAARDRESRVWEHEQPWDGILSRAEHEQFGLKRGSPLPKAKYTPRPIANSTVRER